LIAMTDDKQPTGIMLEPRVLLAGGSLALLGIVVLAAFMWMVPKASAREVASACAALQPAAPYPQLCPSGVECKFPLVAPDFTAIDNQGKQVHLSDFRGKVVFLNFWASWCGVCESEKPKLEKMAAELGSKDFVVIALASDRSWTDVLIAVVKAFSKPLWDDFDRKRRLGLEDKNPPPITLAQALDLYKQVRPDGIPFKIYLDPPSGDDNIGQIAASWGIKAVPESALIDREGRIVAYYVNKRDWSAPVAQTCLRSVIDE
jgi:thiol-disulfide isomerase/thioredoxin